SSPPGADAAPNDQPARNTVFGGVIGNVLEWYDFAIYGLMAPILGAKFFPSDDPTASLLAAFGVFAVGYAARPLGSIVIGHIGDRYGRKLALVFSLSLMGLATLGMAILPTHAQVGVTAAVLIVLLRLFQGFSAGGESGSSIVFLAEHAPTARRCTRASWAQFGTVAGILAGSAVGSATSAALGEGAMHDWGWRIPFALGAVTAVLGIVVRRNLTEPPGHQHRSGSETLPVVVAVRDYWRPLLHMATFVPVATIGFYLAFIYVASYLTEQMHFSTAKALEINSISLIVMLALTVPCAMLSDRIGRRPILLAAAVGIIVLSWPLWWLMHRDAFALVLAGQIGFAAMFGFMFSSMQTVMAEMLPSRVRCTGSSLVANVCTGLVGGTTPLVATYLVARTADDFAPVYYLIAAGILLLGGAFFLRETAGKPLP
ncbi:MAG: MFS transporter, partial [Pseudomonadota bacterium]